MIIETKKGRIEGVLKEGYTVYRGIPYAKSPTGELRLAAPVPADDFEDIFKADHFGPIAPQRPQMPDTFYGKEFYADGRYWQSMSEDCLYLNIWVPAHMENAPLPVAFWIHGGAFLHGFGHEMEFDGGRFCQQGVILVTANYRTGILGFLSHPWLSGREYNGNFGLLDQIAALKWVKDNIASFGGDPENITVFGQSAGAVSVQALISSPMTKGLITRAIMHSGAGYKNGLAAARKMEDAWVISEQMMRACGIDSVEELMTIDMKTLLRRQYAFLDAHPELTLALGPVLDGKVLTEDFETVVDTGRISGIPCMLGANGDDIIPGLQDGCERFALAGSAAGGKCCLWHFDRKLPGDTAGAFHSSELWYVFGTYGDCWRPMTSHDAALSEEMMKAWTDFMKSGDPGWRAYRKEDPFIRVFK